MGKKWSPWPETDQGTVLCPMVLTGDQLFLVLKLCTPPPPLIFLPKTSQPQAWIKEVRLYAFLVYVFPSRLKIACLGLGNNSIEQEEKQ